MELRATIRWSKFKDGWPDIFIENVDEVAVPDSSISFSCSYHDSQFSFSFCHIRTVVSYLLFSTVNYNAHYLPCYLALSHFIDI